MSADKTRTGGLGPRETRNSRPRSTRKRRVVIWVGAALVAVVAATAVMLVTIIPGIASDLAAEVSNGDASHSVASPDYEWAKADVQVAEGWTVQPLVEDLSLPALSEIGGGSWLKDPRIVLGTHRGILIHSPDAGLRVALSFGTGPNELASNGQPVLVETLASGATLRHFSVENTLTGQVDLGETPLSIVAEVTQRAKTGKSERSLDDYRPALSELLESIHTK